MKEKNFEQSVQAALDKGLGRDDVKMLRKFKEWLASQDTMDELAALQGSARKECVFDPKKLDALVTRALTRLES